MKLTMGHGCFVMLGMVLTFLCRCEAFIASSVAGLHRSSPAANAATLSSSLPPWSSTRTRMMLAPFAGAAAAHLISSSPLNPDHLVLANSQPTHLVAVKEIREGIYGPYEVEVTEKAPETDFGISTFKKKEDTEEGRDKYVSVLAVLLAGSFIIPMVQYWWYVRDDDRPIK